MFSTLDEDVVDALLAGDPTSDTDLAPISELAAALRRSRAAEPAPTMSPALRAQLSPRPVSVPLVARRAGRGALTRAGAVAAAASVVVVGLGVGASQNRLPTALQDVVSSTAELVGIDVPTTQERPGDPPTRAEAARHRTGTPPGRTARPGPTTRGPTRARVAERRRPTPVRPATRPPLTRPPRRPTATARQARTAAAAPTRVLVGRTRVLVGRTRMLVGRTRMPVGRTRMLVGRTRTPVGPTRTPAGVRRPTNPNLPRLVTTTRAGAKGADQRTPARRRNRPPRRRARTWRSRRPR